jgi:DNA-binding GntR family transcriptional regulator
VAAPKQTRAAAVRKQMRDDILAGRLSPGQRLMFPDLCERYEASVGVVREALTSLVSDGLVRAQAHQGHVVTPLSHADLAELAAARTTIEPLVLRESIEHGDVQWEAQLVAAHHVLARTPRVDPEDPERASDEWAAAHEAFHEALFAGCGNTRLLRVTRSLAEEAALYRRWSIPLEAERDVAGEHDGLLAAAISRDADLAAERLCEHIARTAELLITHSEDEHPSAAARD